MVLKSFGVTLRDSATVTSSSIDYIKEQGSTGWKYAGNINNSRPPMQSKGFSAKKFFSKADLRDCAELMTSCKRPEDIYYNILSEDESIDQLRRRFDIVKMEQKYFHIDEMCADLLKQCRQHSSHPIKSCS